MFRPIRWLKLQLRKRKQRDFQWNRDMDLLEAKLERLLDQEKNGLMRFEIIRQMIEVRKLKRRYMRW